MSAEDGDVATVPDHVEPAEHLSLNPNVPEFFPSNQVVTPQAEMQNQATGDARQVDKSHLSAEADAWVEVSAGRSYTE